MIKAIEIEGFRSIRSLRFELKPLNVLIGPNQSGKTNILDALDLLANAVQGRLRHSLYQSALSGILLQVISRFSPGFRGSGRFLCPRELLLEGH